VVDAMLRRRRFEMASRAISMFGLLDRCDVDLLHRFLSALVTNGQYRLAVEWARKLAEWEMRSQTQLPEFLRWTPSALVSEMVVSGDFDQALKFIHELNLRSEFPVYDLIQRMLAKSQFKQALEHIKRFGLEPEFPPLELMNGMLDAHQWEVAIQFANEVPALWAHFPKEQIVERMIAARDWDAATSYITAFGFDKKVKPSEGGVLPPGTSASGASPVLVDLVRQLIASAELYMAMRKVLTHELQQEFPPRRVIQNMIDMKQHEHALRYMRELKLEEEFRDQMPRIHTDRLAALRSFRAIVKRRADSARLNTTLIGGSSSYSGSFRKEHPGEVVFERLWYRSPDVRTVTAIPDFQDEVEIQRAQSTYGTASTRGGVMRHSSGQKEVQFGANLHGTPQMQPQQLQQQHPPAMVLQQPRATHATEGLPSFLMDSSSKSHEEEIVLRGAGGSSRILRAGSPRENLFDQSSLPSLDDNPTEPSAFERLLGLQQQQKQQKPQQPKQSIDSHQSSQLPSFFQQQQQPSQPQPQQQQSQFSSSMPQSAGRENGSSPQLPSASSMYSQNYGSQLLPSTSQQHPQQQKQEPKQAQQGSESSPYLQSMSQSSPGQALQQQQQQQPYGGIQAPSAFQQQQQQQHQQQQQQRPQQQVPQSPPLMRPGAYGGEPIPRQYYAPSPQQPLQQQQPQQQSPSQQPSYYRAEDMVKRSALPASEFLRSIDPNAGAPSSQMRSGGNQSMHPSQLVGGMSALNLRMPMQQQPQQQQQQLYPGQQPYYPPMGSSNGGSSFNAGSISSQVRNVIQQQPMPQQRQQSYGSSMPGSMYPGQMPSSSMPQQLQNPYNMDPRQQQQQQLQQQRPMMNNGYGSPYSTPLPHQQQHN